MIKIEIVDLGREHPDTLVKLASFLMDCAGHTLVKAPDDLGQRMKEHMYEPTIDDAIKQMSVPELKAALEMVEKNDLRHLKAAERLNEILQDPTVLTVDELPDNTHGAPYQHCAESGLTEVNPEVLKEDFSSLCFEGKPPQPLNLGDVPAVDPIVCEDGNVPKHSHTPDVKYSLEPSKVPMEDFKEPIVSEKPKSATKRKRTPKFEVIKETGVTEVVEDLTPLPVPSAAFVINGNVLVDKILVGKQSGLITHDEITAIVRKHGLVAIKDIFTNDDLIPAINADLDELLRRK